MFRRTSKKRVLLKLEEIIKIVAAQQNTIIGISTKAKAKLAKAKLNEDINYLATNIQDEKTFGQATEGQYSIYKD